MLLTFFVFDRKCPLWANLVQIANIASLRWNLIPTVSYIIFWDFLMFYQIFLSAQVKRWAIITYEHGMCELPRGLPNNFGLRVIVGQSGHAGFSGRAHPHRPRPRAPPPRQAAQWTITPWELGTPPNIPWSPKTPSQVARQPVRQLAYNIFISNNRASLSLWWKENLAKRQKVSKYYDIWKWL